MTDKEKLIEILNKPIFPLDAVDAVDAMEAVTDYLLGNGVTVREKGEWVCTDIDSFRKYKVTCHFCETEYIGNYDAYDEPYDFNFCPNCGADMRGENHD